MVKLDAELLGSEFDHVANIASLSLAQRGINEINGGDLGACTCLSRIDLAGNFLSNVEALALLRDLKWLSVSGNQLTSLKGLEKLKKLAVLNTSKNKISSIQELRKLKELRALILNDNQISSLDGALDYAVNLDTLVLSQNPLRNLDTSLSKLSGLKKLSLSHCKLKDLETSLVDCTALEELRLAHNKLKKLPKELELNSRLRIIDVGNNNISSWKNVEVLEKLPLLKNVNLRGNPLTEEPNYSENAVKVIQKLRVFDGRATENSRRHKREPKKQEEEAQGGDSQHKNQLRTIEDSNQTGDGIPFVELIAVEPEAKPEDVAAKSIEKKKARRENSQSKRDSKVISITDETKKKHRNKKHRVNSSGDGSGLANALGETEVIGVGGPSSWDT